MNVKDVKLAELGPELVQCAGRWVAIAEDNTIVGTGSTYDEAVESARPSGKEFVLVKVPPTDATLALQIA